MEDKFRSEFIKQQYSTRDSAFLTGTVKRTVSEDFWKLVDVIKKNRAKVKYSSNSSEFCSIPSRVNKIIIFSTVWKRCKGWQFCDQLFTFIKCESSIRMMQLMQMHLPLRQRQAHLFVCKVCILHLIQICR
jgi:hypothetical protein